MHSSGSCFWMVFRNNDDIPQRNAYARMRKHLLLCEPHRGKKQHFRVTNTAQPFSVPQQNMFDILIHFVFC